MIRREEGKERGKREEKEERGRKRESERRRVIGDDSTTFFILFIYLNLLLS